jgi:hypothetical protein
MPSNQNQEYSIRNHYDTLPNLALVAPGTTNSQDQINPTGKGVVVGIGISAIVGGTLTVTIQGKDEASGSYYTLLASAALNAAALTTLTVYPGITVTANVSASAFLPNTWRLNYVAGAGVTSINATIGASVGV